MICCNYHPELTRGKIVFSSRTQHSAGIFVILEVEELAIPVRRGASMRTHRVWKNGQLASGGAWRHCEDDAIAYAEQLLRYEYSAKLSLANQRICKLEVEAAMLRAENEALKEQRDYTEVS
jgi:hypothetical protein